MDRRKFLGNMAVGGAVVAAGGLLQSCKDKSNFSDPVISDFDLSEITISDIVAGMHNGEMTSVSITEKYLERIKYIDANGPTLNSVIELNPDAKDIARKLDGDRANGNVRGPLHGIPVLIKDNIDTGDAMHTTAGSLALNGFKAAKDAHIIKKLRDAGAVIMGKTNLSEWANFRSTRSSSGWSGRGGQTLNPYFLKRSPCGSSSGSGVAVAANLCVAAIGTETDGSVVCPSGTNGIVGIKPTLGLLSRSSIIPISHSQDTAGPMARNVSDAAFMLSAMAGSDPSDDATLKANKFKQDYTKNLNPNGLENKRIGVVRNFMGFLPLVDERMEEAIRTMKNAGALIVDNANIETKNDWGMAEWEVLTWEFKHDLNKYLSERDTPVKTLEEIIRFNEKNAKKEMPWFDQDIFLKSQKKGKQDEDQYKKALEKSKRLTRDEGIDAVMDKHNLDALIAPTNGPAWTIDWVNGDHYVGGGSSAAAIAGYPNITVPAGSVHGLPVGISFFGRAWSEPVLIEIAYAYEQKTQKRFQPEYKESLFQS